MNREAPASLIEWTISVAGLAALAVANLELGGSLDVWALVFWLWSYQHIRRRDEPRP